MESLPREAIHAGLTPSEGPWLALHFPAEIIYIGAAKDTVRSFVELVRTNYGESPVAELLAFVVRDEEFADFAAGAIQMLPFGPPGWSAKHLPTPPMTLERWLAE